MIFPIVALACCLAMTGPARASSRTRLETQGATTIALVVPDDGDVHIVFESNDGTRSTTPPISLRGMLQQLVNLSETVAGLKEQLTAVKTTADSNALALAATQEALRSNATAIELLQAQMKNSSDMLAQLGESLADKADTTALKEKADVSALNTLAAQLRAAPTTRIVNASGAAACTQDLIGGVRYDIEGESLDICNGASWVPSTVPPLGSALNPAASCSVIQARGFARGDGFYYLENSLNPNDGTAVRIYCRMSGSAPVSLGGDGRTAAAAAASCQTALDHFDGETGIYFLAASKRSDAEDLALTGTIRALCNMTGNTAVTESFDGSAESLPAASCAVLKQYFTAESGVYWVDLDAPRQLLCDTEHPDGISLGGDGSSAALVSSSCRSLKTHRNETGSSAPSAVYFVQSPSDPTVVMEVFCDMSGEGVSLGGNGSTALLASVSCAALKAHFNKPTAYGYFLEEDGNAENGNNAIQRACFMARLGEDVGGNGETREAAARSCRHLFNVGFTASKTYWIDPSGTDAFQAYCFMGDTGGWMKVLDLGSSNHAYKPSTSAFGDISVATITQPSKLADSRINAVGTQGAAGNPVREFRVVSPRANSFVYIRTSTLFDDMAQAWGFSSVGQRSICQRNSYVASCYQSTTLGYLDTLVESLAGNDCNRMFVDHNGAKTCYSPACTDCRCLNAGQSCSTAGLADDHTAVRGMQLFVREDSL